MSDFLILGFLNFILFYLFNTVKVYIFGRVLYVCVYIYIHTHTNVCFLISHYAFNNNYLGA